MRTGWTKQMVIDWHKQALPDCTVNDQRIKVHREAQEFYFAKLHGDKKGMLEEIADYYIASLVLDRRFHDYSAKFVCERIEHLKSFDRIKQAVDAKMDINATRVFKKINGEWRHIEE